MMFPNFFRWPFILTCLSGALLWSNGSNADDEDLTPDWAETTAKTSPSLGQHPLGRLDRKYRPIFQTLAQNRAQQDALVARYVQEVQKVFKDEGIKFKAGPHQGRPWCLRILPDPQGSIFNQLAADLAQDHFTLAFAGRLDLNTNLKIHKYQISDYPGHTIYLGSWYIAGILLKMAAGPLPASSLLHTERELIKLYQQNAAAFIFFSALKISWTAHQWPFASAALDPADLLIDPAAEIFIPTTFTTDYSTLNDHRTALRLYHKLQNLLAHAPADPTLYFRTMRHKFGTSLLNASLKLLDLNLLIYFLAQNHPALQISLRPHHIDISLIPQPKIPAYRMKLQIPGPYRFQAGDPPSALLQEPNLQRIYFYTKELFYLLRKNHGDIRFNLVTVDPVQINKILERLRPLLDLPATIYTRPLLNDFKKYWQADYRYHQKKAIKTLKDKLQFGRPCHTYLVAPIFQSKASPSPARPEHL
jgi:hypothetical protein